MGNRYDERFRDPYDDRYSDDQDEPQNHYLAPRGQHGLPAVREQSNVPARRQMSAFGQRQARQLAGHSKIQDEIQVRGARQIRRAQRTVSREFWPWGTVRREVIAEDLFEGEFFNQGFDNFED